MATAMKQCRVCGKAYKACRTASMSDGVFRWQEVACSPECGSVYLRRVNEARGIADTEKKKERFRKSERNFHTHREKVDTFDDSICNIEQDMSAEE